MHGSALVTDPPALSNGSLSRTGTSKPLIRGANNGITAIIDEQGGIVGKLPQFERATLEDQVTPREGLTPFARFGSAPILLISLIFPLFIGIKARRQQG